LAGEESGETFGQELERNQLMCIDDAGRDRSGFSRNLSRAISPGIDFKY
jgi:hypothetical protein